MKRNERMRNSAKHHMPQLGLPSIGRTAAGLFDMWVRRGRRFGEEKRTTTVSSLFVQKTYCAIVNDVWSS